LNYKESIDWILEKLPFYQEKGNEAYKPGLERITSFLKVLNNPHKNLKFIHVGGTNGKGSTCHYLSSILQESGYSVGLFTSPHFFDYRERIRINNKKITKSYVNEFINSNKDISEDLSLSFFELSFGLAAKYFYENKIDIAIIEVGLGGRLDATNVINPLMSIITNVSLDHTDLLGDTPQEIAQEKSGIIKEDSIAIIGENNNLTDQIFISKAREQNSIIHFNDMSNESYSNVLYQNKNISTAIYAIKYLQGFNISKQNIEDGIDNIIENTGYFGRWFKLSEDPAVLVDVAHNISGFEYLALQIEKLEYNNLHIILGFVKGKNIKELIDLLPFKASLHFTQPSIYRGMGQEELSRNIGKNFNFDKNPRSQFLKVKNIASKGDLIIITGSNFLINDIIDNE
tara:strand:- start:1247 stop:2446 length:1200 start_codon:yes stop_codon:yes gene_type:complete